MEGDKPLEGAERLLMMTGISLATFLMVLDYSIANVAIPYIAGDLGTSNAQGTYLITFFAVGSAISLPLAGWLNERFGRARTLLVSLFAFILVSWACALVWTFPLMILMRFLQGFVSGPIIPMSQSLILAVNPPNKRRGALAFWSMVSVVAPVFGPILGGWLSFNYGWPWIFYINLPIGFVAFALIWKPMRGRFDRMVKIGVDWLGFALLAVGVTALQIFLDKGQEWDWFGSARIRTLALVAFLSFAYLILFQLRAKKPLLDLSLLKIPQYTISLIVLIFTYGLYFGSVVLVPLWLQSNMGYTSTWAGLAVAPLGLAPVLFGRYTPRLIDRFGHIPVLCLAVIGFLIGSIDAAFFATNVDFWHVALSRFVFGIGLIFLMPAMIGYSMVAVPEERRPMASGIFHFVRAMIGGIGTAIFTTLWYRRTSFHHARLADDVVGSNESAIQLFVQLEGARFNEYQATEIVNISAQNQAAMLGMNDCFWMMVWFFGLLIAGLLLVHFRSLRRGARAVEES